MKNKEALEFKQSREKIQAMFPGDLLAQFYATAICMVNRKKNPTDREKEVLKAAKKLLKKHIEKNGKK